MTPVTPVTPVKIASVSIIAETPVDRGDLVCAPDGTVLGVARNDAYPGQQVGVAVTAESGWNVYSTPGGPSEPEPTDGR